MKTGFIIALSVLSGLALLLILLRLASSAAQKKLETYIQDHFAEKNLVGATTRANFLGELSRGGRQMRGNGALVLTENTMHFIRAVPFRTYEIPLASITEISMPRSFNGKSVLARLLCVQYRTQDGPDAMAWAVKNPERWKTAMENLRAKGR